MAANRQHHDPYDHTLGPRQAKMWLFSHPAGRTLPSGGESVSGEFNPFVTFRQSLSTIMVVYGILLGHQKMHGAPFGVIT